MCVWQEGALSDDVDNIILMRCLILTEACQTKIETFSSNTAASVKGRQEERILKIQNGVI